MLADATQYQETLRESPWNVVFIDNFTLNELVRVITSILSRQRRDFKPRLGVNKAWGRGKLTYLYADLIDVLRLRSFEVVDATSILAEAFDKPYEDEIAVIRWISEASSKAGLLHHTLKPSPAG